MLGTKITVANIFQFELAGKGGLHVLLLPNASLTTNTPSKCIKAKLRKIRIGLKKTKKKKAFKMSHNCR